jgi:type IV secretion system protein VirD4
MNDLHTDLPRGVRGRTLEEQRSPQARWKETRQIISDSKYEYKNDGIFLGQVAGQFIGIKDDRHAMLVAGSRAGKGRAVLVNNLLEYKGSVLAIDPKGELADITARRRGKGGALIHKDGEMEGLGQTIAVLDPFNRTAPWVQEYKASYNPLSILNINSPTIVEDASLISDAIVIATNEKEPHWDDSAKNFIEGVILHVVSYRKYRDRCNLVTVWELISNGVQEDESSINENQDDEHHLSGMDLLQEEISLNVMELKLAGHEDIAGIIEAASDDFFEKPSKERMSVLSTARRHIKFLGYPRLRDVLTGHDFDLTNLKTDPNGMTIYLCLPAGRMGTCSRWLRLFINLTLEAMEREELKADPPVLLCLDEFPVLGHMKQIEDAAGQIAGFGVKLWTILQDLTQLKSLYKERWETFMGNSSVIQFFGNNDVTTLKWISERVGKTSLIVHSGSDITEKQQHDGASGDSWKLEVQDLLTPSEAAKYFRRNDQFQRQLVIYADDDPLILERVNYDEHEYFDGKYDISD